MLRRLYLVAKILPRNLNPVQHLASLVVELVDPRDVEVLILYAEVFGNCFNSNMYLVDECGGN